MSNIFNHNRPVLNFTLLKADYWDFHLSADNKGTIFDYSSPSDACLSASIDTDDAECVWMEKLMSKEGYSWEDAVNEDAELDHIGYVGMDDGIITYDVGRISNKDFLDLFFNSVLSLSGDGTRLVLRKVDGNNGIYSYTNDLVKIDGDGNDSDDGIQVARLNGGFYQGFFKAEGYDYQVLPTTIGDGWTLDVVLRPEDFAHEDTILNDNHPDNKGIFLYIGTRAEDKWWTRYTVSEEFDKNANSYASEDYASSGIGEEDCLNSPYVVKDNPEDYEDMQDDYFADDYVEEDYKETCEDCKVYNNDGYFAEEEEIDPNMDIETDNGDDFNNPNVYEITTDNKFLFFNRTKEGEKTCNWDGSTEVTIRGTKTPDVGNYFLLFNRTKHGYNTCNIDSLIESESNTYSVLEDLYRNAIAFQITDGGAIGYKYLVKDCDSEEEAYEILSEFTGDGIVSSGEWHTVTVKIVPEDKKYSLLKSTCSSSSAATSMKIYIYVDGRLVLRSKKMPMLNLKALSDLAEKQEGVPYNISLGGGTQGLCDVVYLNYLKLPEYVLPLEKEFAGTFIGYVKELRFHDCQLSFNDIRAWSEKDGTFR